MPHKHCHFTRYHFILWNKFIGRFQLVNRKTSQVENPFLSIGTYYYLEIILIQMTSKLLPPPVWQDWSIYRHSGYNFKAWGYMIKHKLPKSLGQYFRKAQNIFKKLTFGTFDWNLLTGLIIQITWKIVVTNSLASLVHLSPFRQLFKACHCYIL